MNATINITALTNSLNNSGSSSNNIAIAAAILAAAAFVVAIAQTVLQYASSSTSRNKCTFSAIDASFKQVKLRWSWRFWRLRVYYPVLDFGYGQILDLMLKSSLQAINSPTSPIDDIRDEHKWNWSSIEEKDDLKRGAIADAYTKMVDGKRVVNVKDLSWRERWTLRWWKFRHPSQVIIRPRASWAQLLLAFGVRDTSDITYKHADADLIPSSFDAPVQRIKLYDLGCLALLLGFTTVKIDVRERNFEATGPFATITTMTLPDTGKILRFEGDIFAISKSIRKGLALFLLHNSGIINANLAVGPEFTMNGYLFPLHILKEATAERWDKERFNTEMRTSIHSTMGQVDFSAGQIGAEAALFRELYERALKTERPRARRFGLGEGSGDFAPRQRGEYRTSTGLSARNFGYLLDQDNSDPCENFEGVCSQWQDATSQKVPTILAAGALVLLNGAIMGFPLGLLITPFLPWIRRRAKALRIRQPAHIKVCQELLYSMRMGSLKFLREADTFWVSRNYIGLSVDGEGGWIHRDIREIYDTLDAPIQNEIIIKDAEGNPTGEVRAVLFPDCLLLLEKFNPTDWAATIESILVMAVGEYNPVNMLWAQVLLLDVSIHYLVRGGWVEGGSDAYEIWTKETCAVYSGVVDSWSNEPQEKEAASPTDEAAPSVTQDQPPSTTSGEQVGNEPSSSTATTEPASQEPTFDEPSKYADWDLAGALEKQPDLKFSEDPVKRKEKIRQLADLLELRALFVLAFYLLGPDSSDVYVAERSDVEMPMI